MALDDASQLVLDLIAKAGRPELWTLDVKAARAQADPLSDRSEHRPEEVARVEDRTIPGPGGELPIRIYWPVVGEGPLPILVYYHGGGFTLRNLDTHDSVCRTLGKWGGCLTVAVDYRMGPETKFPGAVEDAFAAVEWVSANAADLGGDPTRLAVGGDSAGGNLAAVVCHLSRDHGGPAIVFQLLVYPATDGRRGSGIYPSYEELSQGYFLTHEMMEWFSEQYTDRNTDLGDPRISPLLTQDHGNLPPAFVITAGYDPLKDEGKAYAEALSAAGVLADHKCYETTIHGFLSMGRFIPTALEALDDCAARLRAALGRH